jgi:hypothetical protein
LVLGVDEERALKVLADGGLLPPLRLVTHVANGAVENAG